MQPEPLSVLFVLEAMSCELLDIPLFECIRDDEVDESLVWFSLALRDLMLQGRVQSHYCSTH